MHCWSFGRLEINGIPIYNGLLTSTWMLIVSKCSNKAVGSLLILAKGSGGIDLRARKFASMNL